MALSTEKAKSSKNSLIQDSHPRPHEQNPHTDSTRFNKLTYHQKNIRVIREICDFKAKPRINTNFHK